MIKIQNNTATREPLPSFLQGLAPESLRDLSWTDPQLGVHDSAWLPERDDTPELPEGHTFDGTESLTIKPAEGVVSVVRSTRPLTEREKSDAWLQAHPVPASCTRRQGRLALLQAGKLDTAEAAIAAIADPAQKRAAQIEYEADTWERNNAFLVALWLGMGGALDDLDALFVTAETL